MSDVINMPVAVQLEHVQWSVESFGTVMVPRLSEPVPVKVFGPPLPPAGAEAGAAGAGAVTV
jgi:hypothetical protein